MKRRVLLFFFSLFVTGLWAFQSPRGYIITLSNAILTGKIAAINPSGKKVNVVFINDFGDIYPIHPSLIKGFVFQRDTSIFIYESKKAQEQWLFMQVLAKGKGLNLYRAPEPVVQIGTDANQVRPDAYYYIQRYWIEINKNRLFPLQRAGYKKNLRKLFQESAPELAEKIGQPGYRFQNLVQIVEEYNQIVSSGRIIL